MNKWVFVVVALISVMLLGCSSGDDQAAKLAAANVMPPPAGPPGLPPAGPAGLPPAAPPGAPQVAAPVLPNAVPVTFVWTETPSFNMIPPTPPTGMANNQPMAVPTILFEPGAQKWRLVLGETALPTPTDFLQGQYVSIDLPEEPAVGKSWLHPMEYGGGYFQIKDNPADPAKTTSWNADNAWAVEITQWNVAPYDEAKGMFQAAGTASGHVAVCYKGSGALQNSYVSGTFTGALVRYMGKPTLGEKQGARASTGSAGGKAKSDAGSKSDGSKVKTDDGGKGTAGGGTSQADLQKRLNEEADKRKVDIDKAKAGAGKKGISFPFRPVMIKPAAGGDTKPQ